MFNKDVYIVSLVSLGQLRTTKLLYIYINKDTTLFSFVGWFIFDVWHVFAAITECMKIETFYENKIKFCNRNMIAFHTL